MIVTSEIVQLKLPESRTIRSMGVHQSAIIRCVATEYGLLKPEWAEELSLVDVRTITDQKAILRICMGLAWEEWYIGSQIDDVIDHPDEIQYEGVYMSLDGESLSVVFSHRDNKSVVTTVIHEVKSTYKSPNNVGLFDTPDRIRKNWMWLAQLKSYCIAKGTRFACLHVLYFIADYKAWPKEPLKMKYHIEFTEEELQENWTFLKDYRDHRMEIENQ